MYEQAAEEATAPLATPLREPAIAERAPSPAGLRVTALLEVMLCSGYPTQLTLVLIMTGLGMSMRTAAGGLTPSFIFVLSLVDAVLVVALVLFFIKARGEAVRDVLLGDRAACCARA